MNDSLLFENIGTVTPLTFELADGRSFNTKERGTKILKLSYDNNEESSAILLNIVYFVPELDISLVSFLSRQIRYILFIRWEKSEILRSRKSRNHFRNSTQKAISITYSTYNVLQVQQHTIVLSRMMARRVQALGILG